MNTSKTTVSFEEPGNFLRNQLCSLIRLQKMLALIDKL